MKAACAHLTTHMGRQHVHRESEYNILVVSQGFCRHFEGARFGEWFEEISEGVSGRKIGTLMGRGEGMVQKSVSNR